jgi:DNA polymerase-3 subunit epsilon
VTWNPNALPIAFVDLETTGGNATHDRITEIGIVEIGPDGISEWSSLVNPECSIPPAIQSLTGISNDMVADAPTFAGLAREIHERLSGRIFVAHNARFDYGFLKQSLAREGYAFRPTVLCTVKLSRYLFPHYPRHNLDSLIERHGLVADGRHRALADAQLIYQFWNKVHEFFQADILNAALKHLTGRPSLPPHLDAAMVDDLPDCPGVYLFYADNDLPLYIGKAKEIRKRVLSHFAADHSSSKEMSLAQQVKRIEYIETGGEIGALLREAILIKKMLPTHNRQLRRNKELCSIRLSEHPAHGLVPEIVFAGDLDFGRQDKLYGLFKTQREAKAVLKALADEHRLCEGLLGLEKLRAGGACFGFQIKKCGGACIGKEPALNHAARLLIGLSKLKLQAWPFPGPAIIREGHEVHVIDHWSYLGSAQTEAEIWQLLESGKPQFDRDTYKILQKAANKLFALKAKA